mmetsp:Transcript_19753/g.57663  ORF Transcript_19753/g.57663 Transcript_19753/m.57663 type:complete len:282 (+) Transcript_19753:850-1695(+)
MRSAARPRRSARSRRSRHGASPSGRSSSRTWTSCAGGRPTARAPLTGSARSSRASGTTSGGTWTPWPRAERSWTAGSSRSMACGSGAGSRHSPRPLLATSGSSLSSSSSGPSATATRPRPRPPGRLSRMWLTASQRPSGSSPSSGRSARGSGLRRRRQCTCRATPTNALAPMTRASTSTVAMKRNRRPSLSARGTRPRMARGAATTTLPPNLPGRPRHRRRPWTRAHKCLPSRRAWCPATLLLFAHRPSIFMDGSRGHVAAMEAQLWMPIPFAPRQRAHRP